MENMEELIPFAKEMLSQKPGRGLLKVYLVGSVFAVLGTVIGLVESVCQPFSCGEPMDAEMLLMLAQQQRGAESETRVQEVDTEEEEEKDMAPNTNLSKEQTVSQRSISNRLHAS